MILSIYPTDGGATIKTVLNEAQNRGEKLVFTSLHMPESRALKNFLSVLKDFNSKTGISFMADISPLAFEKLDLKPENISELKKYGISGLRADFGFTAREILSMAQSGFKTALNASAAEEELVATLKNFDAAGWHNFYPRPGTGLEKEYFLSQNNIFKKYAMPLYAFIPGEQNFRAPLCKGLPTIETQRGANAYVNYVELKHAEPELNIVLAEGIPFENNLKYIDRFEKDGVLTLPLDADIGANLMDKPLAVRKEHAPLSWRVENTRGLIIPPARGTRNAPLSRGCVAADSYARYAGEIHIIKNSGAEDEALIKLCALRRGYENLVCHMDKFRSVEFTKPTGDF